MKLTKKIQKTVKASTYVMLALVMAFSVSCSPEDGRDGTPGEQGPAGQDGNANVTATDWFQIEFTDTNGSDTFGAMDIELSNFQELINQGAAVIVYLKVGSTTDSFVIIPFPYEASDDQFSFALINVPASGIEKSLRIYISGTVVSDYENDSSYEIQYIIIPANSNKNNIDFTKMSYKEVVNQLGLDY